MSVDKHLVSMRFAKHYADYHTQAITQQRIAHRLADCIEEQFAAQSPKRALEIGMGTGFLTKRLTSTYPKAHWYLNDLVEDAWKWVDSTQLQVSACMGDAEEIDLPQNLDLIASSSAFQWFDDLEGFFKRAKQALREDGLLAYSSFGTEHMKELRQLTGAGLTYFNLEQHAQLLRQAGFELVHQHETMEQLKFPSGRAVLEHLRQTGVNSMRTEPWTPRKLADFNARYHSQWADEDAMLPLSYQALIVLARPL